MEEECIQWERLAGEYAEAEKYYEAANRYKQAASCYLESVIEMTRKAAEFYHIYAETSVERDEHRKAATAYFEAATQYRNANDFATALSLYENAANEALLERMTETAAQSYLWAAFMCHKLNNKEYFLTAAKNMARLYNKASDKALDDGKAERAVIDLSLGAMGYATIEETDKAKELIEKANRVIEKTRWDWLKTLLAFSEALTEDDLEKASDMLAIFKEEDTIQQVMGACLDIREDVQRKRRLKDME